MSRLMLDRGVDRDFDLRVHYGPDHLPYGEVDTEPSPFFDTDTLVATVWLGDDAPAQVTPTAVWLDAAGSASYRVSFTETDTATLEPGVYAIRVTVTRGSLTASVHDGDLEIAPSPGPTITPGTPPTFVPGTERPRLDTVYCTDEDVALALQRDFKALCPPWMLLASGKDGAFATTSPWILSSASVDFEASGVVSGNVVYLDRPGVAGGTDLLAVGAVNGHSLLLRRLNRAAGSGAPPGPAAGTNGVGFGARTFEDLIEDAAFEINALFGIDPDLPDHDPVVLQRPRELRRLAVLTVIIRAYTANWQAKSDDWAMKLELYQREWEDVRARLVLHMTDSSGLSVRFFGMRVSR